MEDFLDDMNFDHIFMSMDIFHIYYLLDSCHYPSSLVSNKKGIPATHTYTPPLPSHSSLE